MSIEEKDFLKRLETNETVSQLATFYGVDVELVVYRLRVKYKVNRYQNGEIKKVSIDCTDSNSGITIKDEVKYTPNRATF